MTACTHKAAMWGIIEEMNVFGEKKACYQEINNESQDS